jgi:hypothetical protein
MAHEEFDSGLDVYWGEDKDYWRATIIGQVSAKDTRHPVIMGQSLPTKHARMSDRFKKLLQRAYFDYYGEPEIYQFPHRLQYANKSGFSERYVPLNPFPSARMIPRAAVHRLHCREATGNC